MFIQQLIEKFLAVMKIRALEPLQRGAKIDQAALGPARKKAQCSGNLEAFPQRGGSALALIDQNQISS